jgi:WD40 repeat protein
MTGFRILCVAAISILFNSLAPAQEETTATQLQPPVMTVDFVGKPFPGGLRFSADSSRLWTDRLEAWSVRDGQRADSSPIKRFKDYRLIIDLVANEQSMLIAMPESGELLFWDQSRGLRRRVLKQTGNLVAARYIDQGKRFALVFSKPPSIYYGNADSDENDSTVPLSIEVSKCTISPDGNLVAVRNDCDIEIWDVKKGGIRTKLQHEHKPFSFTFSHDGRWIATGTSNDNMVRLFDTSRGALACELKAHTRGTIFLGTAVYSLAFASNGKWLASGGHDGRVVVWDLAKRKPLGQTHIEGPPIVCSLAFSPDSSLLAGSFENASAKRGIRVWRVLGDTD